MNDLLFRFIATVFRDEIEKPLFIANNKAIDGQNNHNCHYYNTTKREEYCGIGIVNNYVEIE